MWVDKSLSPELQKKEGFFTIKSSDYLEKSIETCDPLVTRGWRIHIGINIFSGDKNTLNELTQFELSIGIGKYDNFRTTLGDRNATRFVYKGVPLTQDCILSSDETSIRILAVSKAGVDYIIEARFLDKDEKSVSKTVDLILSTFKFLD